MLKSVIQQDLFDEFKAYLDRKGIEFTNAAQRMVYAPLGAEMIKTKQTALPGYRIENVFVMAGVPRIMRIMLEAIVERLKIGNAILSSTVHANVREGEIAESLAQIQLSYVDVAIGSYPQDKDSKISDYSAIFVVRGVDQQVIDEVCEAILAACHTGGYEAIRV